MAIWNNLVRWVDDNVDALVRAFVGVLGTGVPRLACLWPTAWLHQRPGTAHLHQQTHKILTRGKPREADDTRPPQGCPH